VTAHTAGNSRQFLRAGVCSRLSKAAVAAFAVVLTLSAASLAGCSPVTAVEPGDLPEGPAPSPAPDGPAAAVSRVPTDEKLVALTFDAGSDAGHTQVILDILAEHEIRATFFFTGAWLDSYPELGRAVAAAGHALGNHTYTHPHLTELTDAEVRRELADTDARAREALGRSLEPLFRPPFGEYDDRVAELVAREGYRYIVMWTVDSLDWKMIPPGELIERVLDGVLPGAIVLMHVGSRTYTPEALPGIISRLSDSGYRFVTLPELLDELPAGCIFHTVAAGETLSVLAQRYGVDVSDILALNGLEDPDKVRAGQVLVIPPSDEGA